MTQDSKWLADNAFDAFPFNVAIVDREFNIVKANSRFEQHFGPWKGKKCYAVYKNSTQPCRRCNAHAVFKSGKPSTHDSVGRDQDGRPTHYVVHAVPMKRDDRVEYVMELSSDVTDKSSWQQQSRILFDRVPCFISLIDKDFRIILANESFRKHFGEVLGKPCFEVYKQRDSRCPTCPAAKTFKDGKTHRSSQTGRDKNGDVLHYVVSTSPLTRDAGDVSHVIEISTDVTELKRLEKEVIDAERLAAVGQTVAGLAHSIKNILMGLEGGKYIVSMGLKNGNADMIARGWDMLERNFEKTTSLVKDFLSFSKGRLPQLSPVDPEKLVDEIIDLYRDVAAQSGVDLCKHVPEPVREAPLDPDGIHTCLTNLVSNAIDACLMGEKRGNRVLLTVKEQRGHLVFEVEDNGAGIDHEIKKKIFTTFFTTKGGKGTGLGLLTTRKITQEHGGKLTVRSQPEKGSIFRMSFSRKRLLDIYERDQQEGE